MMSSFGATTWVLSALVLVLPSACGASTEDALAALRSWEEAIVQSLAEMDVRDPAACPVTTAESGLRAWVVDNCGTEQAFLCTILIDQDMQRFGRFRQMSAQGNPEEAINQVDTVFKAERLEMSQKRRQLRQMIAFLEDAPGAQTFSDKEVADQVAKALSAQGGKSRRVTVSIGVPIRLGSAILDEQRSCIYNSLVKPESMYLGLALAEASPVDESNQPLASRMEAGVFSGALSLYQSSFTLANNRYAEHNLLITYVWLYVLDLWAFMVPLFGSGPFMPEASSHSSCVGFLPWWNMFGPGVPCASPLGIVLETANPGASSWFTSCEFGLLTFSPAGSARSSCWMIPGIGQIAQLVPGRMLPDRTFFGSHPSGCLNSYGRPDIYSPAEVYLASGGQGYDPELVNLLYSLHDENVSFSKATFFTTSLTHLALLGWYPRNAAFQHHGVQLELPENSPVGIPSRRGVPFKAGARVLTVEMMSEGLLWSLRDSPLQDVHSTETYEFDALSPQVIADYILDQKGTTYRDHNCQHYARHMMDRMLLHGGNVQNGGVVIGDGPELTYRLIMFTGVLGCLVVSSFVLQWGLCWRALSHFIHTPVDTKACFPRLSYMAFALSSDACILENWAATTLGSRVAINMRRAVVVSAMLMCPPLFWYVVAKSIRRRCMPMSPDVPLLA